MQNCGYHRVNRCSDKQNKDRWGMQNCGYHRVNRCSDKQNKDRWGLRNCASGNEYIGKQKNGSMRKTVEGLFSISLTEPI